MMAAAAMAEYRIGLEKPCFSVLDGLGISERECQNIKISKIEEIATGAWM